MLGPCTACRRHVRLEERACPFCGAAVAISPPASTVVGRFSRAALMTLTSLGVVVTGCPKTPENETIVQPYGAPPMPTPPDAAPEVAPPASSTKQ